MIPTLSFYGGGYSSSDPYLIVDFSSATIGYQDIINKTQTPSAITAGEDTLVLIIVGDSLAANCVNSNYVVTQARNTNYNIYSGGCYQTKEPMMGTNISGFTNTGHWASQLGDRLISGGTTARSYLTTAAVGGTLISQWTQASPQPGQRQGIIARRLASISSTFLSAVNTRGAILQVIGSNDTNAGTTSSAFQASQTTAIQLWRDAGLTCPYYVAVDSWFNGTTSSAVTGAQAAVVNGTTIKAGPNLDSITSSNRYDNTHWNITGATLVSCLWFAILDADF